MTSKSMLANAFYQLLRIRSNLEPNPYNQHDVPYVDAYPLSHTYTNTPKITKNSQILNHTKTILATQILINLMCKKQKIIKSYNIQEIKTIKLPILQT